mgnify:CR=1 FL=1
MSKYDGRFKALERKLPKGYIGDFEIWLENEDGTLTDGKRTITEEQFKREAAERGEEIITIGYTEEEKEADRIRTERWHENRKRWGLE